MDSNLPALSSFSHQKKPSLPERLRETKPMVIAFTAFFLLGFTFPIFSLFLPHWLFMPSPFFPLQILMLFSVGLIFGLGVVLIVRQISRGVWGGDKRKLETLEKRLMSHTDPHEVLIDLDALISENLRLKRPQVAEFYSKQLLLISEKLDSHETPKIELMLSEAAWVSTPAYHKRVNYWLVWLFESRGTLSLTSEHLEYESPRISFKIALADIVDVGLQNHPWWLKPIPMHYIRVTYSDQGLTESFYITPCRMQTDTVFDVNNQVKEWYGYLTKALQKVA